MTLTSSLWTADATDSIRDTTVGQVLRDAAAAAPDAPALVEGVAARDRRRWSFAELLGESERVARALLGRFVPGERVAVWAPGIPEWVLLEYGAALAGLTLVTVNPALRPGELAHVLGQSRASGIVYTPSFRSPMEELLAEVRPGLPLLREAIRFTEWAAFLDSGSSSQALPEVRAGDPAQIQYTSGTTGRPKGALLHHRGITNNARLYAQRAGLGPGDRYVNPMPLFHTAGCVMGVLGAVQSGAALVQLPAFDPGVMLALAEEEGATLAGGVPTMLVALLEHPDLARRDVSRLRRLFSGGAPVPPSLVARVEERLNAPLLIVFGTTECSPLLSMVAPSDAPEDRAGTLGRPLPCTDVKVADLATGAPAPVGAIGELCARGYLVMTGYFDLPEATAQAIDADGWYHTGDLASMDERGFFRIEGRITDMIIRGGENIYPREIEETLLRHPAVAEVAVIGLPDDRWGEVVAAVVRLRAGHTAAPDALRAHCREHLAPHKTPARWELVDAFPLTASGKIQKYQLRERLCRAPEAAE
jgi:fatty-acyl-CoA synthase